MSSQRPNILLLSTDEHRFDCLGCYGNPVIRTPNLDRIAAEGVRFNRGYVQNPMCMPSRMAIMTGRYCSEHGCNINCTGIPDHEQAQTFMRYLQNAGYYTAAIGKMHMMPKWGPFGFTYLDLVEGKADANNQYIDYLKAKDLNGLQHQARGEKLPFGTYTNALHVDDTIDAFIGRRATRWLETWDETQPFFLWVSFCNPHFPFDPPAPYDILYDPAEVPLPVWREGEMDTKPAQRQLQHERGYETLTESQLRQIVANYYGNITLVDDRVGHILDVLDRRGWTDDTLVAFISDHGDLLGDHRLLLKSGVTFYDSCVRVPYLIRYPRAFPPGLVCDELVEAIDLPATLLDVAGVRAPKTMQGHSLVGLAEGNLGDGPGVIEWRDDAFSEIDLRINPQMHGPKARHARDYVAMICTREWKYVHFPTLDIGELYDLVSDPHELTNLFYDSVYADRVAEMRLRLLNRFMYNQRPHSGACTATFQEFYVSDHRPPEDIPGVTYAGVETP